MGGNTGQVNRTLRLVAFAVRMHLSNAMYADWHSTNCSVLSFAVVASMQVQNVLSWSAHVHHGENTILSCTPISEQAV